MSGETNIVTLYDKAGGSRARVLAGCGFNCFSFQVVQRGETVETLWAPPGFEEGGQRPSSGGIPLLFPFPGRIRGGRFEFAGRAYELETNDGRGNAIHGFVLNRPWVIEQLSPTRVQAVFHSSAHPELAACWPSEFSLRASYELSGNSLRIDTAATNPGERPLPCGLGLHPYFRLPLGAAGSRENCRIAVPASTAWELVDLLPTGRVLPEPSGGELARGLPFAETRFDTVFGGLSGSGGTITARIEDPHNQRRLLVAFDDGFGQVVVYNPPHREAICIEPYSCVPDPFILLAQGVQAGLRVLRPGETYQAWMEIRLE